jgi:ribosomal-protein-alanine N-acetyltransferase
MPIFRKAEQKDITQIAELEKKTFSDAWSFQGILDSHMQSQSFLTVAELEEKIVAYCIVYHVLDEGEVARIAVDEAVRRQGIGRRLLDYTSHVSLEKGVKRLMLDVRTSNVSAQNFYQAYGFQIDGIRKKFYENPVEDAVLMSKVVDKLFH